MADRVTQQVLQVVYQPDPAARVTTVAMEVLQDPPVHAARVTAVAMEVLQSVASSGGGGGGGSTSIMYIIASG